MDKRDLRASLKLIGYKCSFRANPFNPNLASLYLDVDGRKVLVSSASVFDATFYVKHRQAFELCAKFDGKN